MSAQGGREGESKEGETRCGTHSLSMGHSHSLGREGNSAAVLNPANWRNSTNQATSASLPSYLSALPGLLLSCSPGVPPFTFPLPFGAPSAAGPLCHSRRRASAASRDAVVFTDTESIFAMVISPLSRSNRSKIHAPRRVVSRIRNAEQ